MVRNQRWLSSRSMMLQHKAGADFLCALWADVHKIKEVSANPGRAERPAWQAATVLVHSCAAPREHSATGGRAESGAGLWHDFWMKRLSAQGQRGM
jgi:hypothetical protein